MIHPKQEKIDTLVDTLFSKFPVGQAHENRLREELPSIARKQIRKICVEYLVEGRLTEDDIGLDRIAIRKADIGTFLVGARSDNYDFFEMKEEELGPVNTILLTFQGAACIILG